MVKSAGKTPVSGSRGFRSVQRVSGCRKLGELLLPLTLSRSLLLLCPLEAQGVGAPLLSATDVTVPLQAQGLVAWPAEPLGAEAARLTSKGQTIEEAVA